MKKVISVLLILLVLLCACQKQTMTVPEYPLTQESVAQAMELYGFPADVTIEVNDYTQYPGLSSTSYTLRDPGGDFLAGAGLGVLSHAKGEVRSIGLTVGSVGQETITEEECRQLIRFATYLCGGFTDDRQVCDAFMQEFDAGEELLWEARLEGIDCQIIYRPEFPIRLQIGLATDMDEFVHAEQPA